MPRGKCATWPAAAPHSLDITCYGHKGRINVLRNEGVVQILVAVDRETAEVLKAKQCTMTPKAFAILASGIDQKKWEHDRLGWKAKFKVDGKPLTRLLQEWEALEALQVNSSKFQVTFSFQLHYNCSELTNTEADSKSGHISDNRFSRQLHQ